jgi:hypothetical protein
VLASRMTPSDFRRLALSMPRAKEVLQVGRPTSRVGRKTFASLDGPADSMGVIRLTPDQQALFVAHSPAVFAPLPGGWGKLGSTAVRLEGANRAAVEDALAAAWTNVADEGT